MAASAFVAQVACFEHHHYITCTEPSPLVLPSMHHITSTSLQTSARHCQRSRSHSLFVSSWLLSQRIPSTSSISNSNHQNTSTTTVQSLRRQRLPRSRRQSNVSIPSRIFKFTSRFLLEILIVGISLTSIKHCITTKQSILLSSNSLQFVTANLTRWIAASLTIRLIMAHSDIASSVPSLERDEDDKWFLKGSYYATVDDTTTFQSGETTTTTHQTKNTTNVPLQIRQVPGDGSCLFNAIAAGLLFYDSNSDFPLQHPSMPKVLALSSNLRSQAVDILQRGIQQNTTLAMQNDETIATSTLVRLAAEQYGLTPQKYLNRMRKEGVWGGGPEIVALTNGIKRNIVLLEPRIEQSTDGSICLEVIATFEPKKCDREKVHNKAPVYILSTNQQFPKGDIQKKEKSNHFLAVFPSVML